MKKALWTERKFSFDFPEGWIFGILERLYGTVPRLRAMTAGLDDNALSHKPGGAWSIREHIGHLSDLEELHDGRIDDFLAGKSILRAADMSNARTYAASHNTRSLEELIREFENKRSAFIARLEKLSDEVQAKQALHPRLQVQMRPVDMAFFTAEHDDHHLADIRSILKQVSK